MAIAKTKYISAQDYFELEKNSEIRHEYYQGEIFDMAGTTTRHNTIVFNIVSALKRALKKKPCLVFFENIMLEVIPDIYYPYPDVIVTCHKKDLSEERIIRHPTLIMEVLSESSESHDRGFKFNQYRHLESLQHYVLISQSQYLVEIYSRNKDETWTLSVMDNNGTILNLEAVDVNIPLKVIYEDIEIN